MCAPPVSAMHDSGPAGAWHTLLARRALWHGAEAPGNENELATLGGSHLKSDTSLARFCAASASTPLALHV